MRRSLVVIAVVALAASCVSTQKVTARGPDPRASLPPLAPPATDVAETWAVAAVPLPPAHVVALPSDKTAILDLRVVFRAGSADDPEGKEGLTALTARLMTEATVDKDAAALDDALFPMAAELSVQVDKDTTTFIGRVHRDQRDAFLQLFLDVLLKPRLAADDFARLKEEQRAWLTSTLRTGNDEALQREALEAMLFDPSVRGAAVPERHPYRHTPKGTVAGLDAITLDDVHRHIARVFCADRLVIGVGGAIDDALVDRLRTSLASSLPATCAAPASLPTKGTRPAGNKLLIIEKPSAGTAISVGFVLPSLSRSHPDYAAMKLAETWFGEHRNLIGHLFHSMREVRGLNYGDYAYVEHFVQDGWSTFERTNIPRRTQYFSMWIRPVEHKNRLFALRMAAWELARFVERGIPDDESFRRVQSFVAGYWKSKEQEPMRRLGYAIDKELTGQALDRAGLRAAVARLTRAEVNAAIARHLRADGLSFVVVTEDAAPLVAAIVGDAPSPITYAGEVAPAVLEEDKEIVSFDLGLDEDDIVVLPPSALFQR